MTPMLVPRKTYELRPYQTDSIEGLRQGLREGHLLQMLCSPTGSGKTLCAAFLIEEALAKGTKCAFVCDRLPLVGQTSRVFHEFGIPHGIVQGKNTRGREMPVQVCSAQTLEKRGFWPDLGLVVIDEAHTQRDATTKFITSLGKPVIGLSATPFTKGLGKVYSRVVNVVTTDQLLTDIDPNSGRPYLSPLKVYVGREMDMRGAGLDNAGEWKAIEVEQRGGAIIGDAVTEWHKRVMENFGKPVKTLVRSRTIAHGEEICRAFQSAGFDFRQVTAYTSEIEADQMVEDFSLGKFLGLVSVDKFNKGFDVPDILCLSDQRPLRKSLASEIQFLGRGMRASPGKDFVLLLDHTGNYLGFMDDILDFFAEGCNELDEGKRNNLVRREGEERPDVVCPCGYVLPPGTRVCPSCGRERRRRSDVEVRPGQLKELDASREWMNDRYWVWRNICAIAVNRPWGNEESHRKFARVQFHEMLGFWPSWEMDPVDGPPDSRVSHQVRRQYDRWKRRNRQERSG